MGQVVFESSYQGHVKNENANYYTCRDATNGKSSQAATAIGQTYDAYPSSYSIWRGFVYFNTTGIPANAIITSAVIYVENIDYHTTEDFYIIVKKAYSIIHYYTIK